MSLGKRMFRSAGVSLLEHVIKAAALFISTPYMARHLGQEGYGMWLLAMSFLAYLMIVDLGLTFSTTRFLSVAVGAGDVKKQAAVITLSGRYFHWMGWVVVVGSLAAIWLVPWLLAGRGHAPDLVFATLFCGITLSLRFHFRMPSLLLRAHVRYDLQSWASIIRVLVQTTGLIFVLVHGGGFLAVGLVQGLGDCLELALQAVFARSFRLPADTQLASPQVFKELRRDLFHFTRDTLLSSFGEAFRHQVGPMVIGKFRGAAEVSTYSVSLRMIGMSNDVANALFGGVVLTAFGQLHGAANADRLKREFTRMTAVTAGFGAWVVAGLLVFGDAFLHRWLGPHFSQSYELLLILALPHGLVIMQYPAYNLLFTLGKQRGLMWLSCLGGLTVGVLSLLLGHTWGAKGVACVLAVEMLTASLVFIPWLLHKSCKINPVGYLSKTLTWPAIKALILPLVCVWFVREQIRPDYVSLTWCGAVYALTFGLAAPWLLLDAEGRRVLSRSLTSH